MLDIQWSVRPGNRYIGAMTNGETARTENSTPIRQEDYLVHRFHENIVCVRFSSQAKYSDDYGPTILVHSGTRSPHWMRQGSTLYLVVGKGTDTVAIAQQLCQWHHDHAHRWPTEKIAVQQLMASVPILAA